jgi:hypothetical protein
MTRVEKVVSAEHRKTIAAVNQVVSRAGGVVVRLGRIGATAL